ncbi:hepatic lectin-like [Pyxicephalus adspersus]|uniref:hepatic lectin-like n=1 Tax=Pyxicephalus adspersus TaxID=30357 RepID=UPI003B5C3B44
MKFLVILLIFLVTVLMILTCLQFISYFNMMSKMTEMNSSFHQFLNDFDLSCRKGWQRYGLKCYIKSSIKKPWDVAKKDCEEMKAHLVIINEEDEMNFLKLFSQKQYLWVGLREDKPGEWKWVDGTLLKTQMFWAGRQPDNGTIKRILAEDCVQLRQDGLHDVICFDSYQYICERFHLVILPDLLSTAASISS